MSVEKEYFHDYMCMLFCGGVGIGCDEQYSCCTQLDLTNGQVQNEEM